MSIIDDRIRASALWAAYGDAVGFISEGVDERGLARRLAGRLLTTVEWRRRLGRSGPNVVLPAGSYSDDTQLRLATSRATGGDRMFNVQAFSKIELPLWLNYSLGAGRGSLASAHRLAGKTHWSDLVRDDRAGSYVNGGGNGAAMRIQPLAWALPQREEMIRSIILNAACTHGHPKAFVGALFHGELLRQTLEFLALPTINDAFDIIGRLKVTKLLPDEMDDGWRNTWCAATTQQFANVWEDACDEVRLFLEAARTLKGDDLLVAFRRLLKSQGLLDQAERGSATKTAAAAFIATVCFDHLSTRQIIHELATSIGSDTDSISTMAGALLGAARGEDFGEHLQDRYYIENEAFRLAQVRGGASTAQFEYRKGAAKSPSRIRWDESKVQLGALGTAKAIGELFQSSGDANGAQWYMTDFGQTILLQFPAIRSANTKTIPSQEPSLFSVEAKSTSTHSPNSDAEPDPARIAAMLAERGFDPALIGRTLLRAAGRPHGDAFASVIAFELVRQYRRSQRSNEVAVVEPHNENGRKENTSVRSSSPRPAIQLQLSAVPSHDETSIRGFIANYGSSIARNLRVCLDGQSRKLLTLESLDVKETSSIEFIFPNAISSGSRVIVAFRNDEGHYEQEGTFETARGAVDTLLLKGLGNVTVSTASSENA